MTWRAASISLVLVAIGIALILAACAYPVTPEPFAR